MKRVLVKSLKGDLLDKTQVEDPMPWITEGIASNKWGEPERTKKVKNCTRYELANVLKILPPDAVVISADYKFEIIDIQSEALEKEKNRQKRLDISRDWDAIIPSRKEKLIKRLFTYVLENFDVDVSDI